MIPGPLKVGVTGGIGSGKSVVCRMFAMLGVPVYDTDSESKRLMSSDSGIVASVKARFGDGVYKCGVLDRAALAGVVFGDAAALADLESIVHPAVTADFIKWAVEKRGEFDYVIVESAILFESGMDHSVDITVEVSAPEDVRIGRTVRRDGASEDKVMERIAHQMSDAVREELADYIIRNDEKALVWDQVIGLDAVFRSKTGVRYERD